MQAGYAIIDEPKPGGLQRLATNPIWPFFALMFAGAWLAFPWFAANAWAIGSPSKKKETALSIFAFVGTFLLLILMGYVLMSGFISKAAIPYALLVIVAWKLGVGYALFFSQSAAHEIYEYFGGRSRNGIPLVLIAAYFMREPILAMSPHYLWVGILK